MQRLRPKGQGTRGGIVTSGSSDTPNPLTMGEVADKVQAQGSWTHVGPDGTTWTLTYGGAIQLLPDGGWEDIS